ncbi:MAG TPA: hypothetical protein VN282_07020 [Pyrinomonadaceae bacterium]|nr:hypothetical protein [Pyrinomonadaceae bacterium]
MEWVKIGAPAATAILSAGVTAVFGLFIWNAQKSIEGQVDRNNELLRQQYQIQLAQLQAQLSLKETFYKKRLDTYDEACKRIASAQNVLADVGVTKEDSDKATDLVAELDRFRRGNQLYWSQPLDNHLEELWGLGIRKLRTSGAPEDDGLSAEIAKEVKALHEQMKKDLNVAELAKTLQDAAETPSKER